MTDNDGGTDGGMQIDADLVRQLAELLNENDLTEIEVEDGDRRIVVKRQITLAAAAAPVTVPAQPQTGDAAPAPPAPAGPPSDDAHHPGAIKSPMVGTAFLSAEPGSEPFVGAGSKVKAGDTLLIVEAMKVMNPIAAPRAGTVTAILVQDAQPVEYDQPLLIIE